MCPYFIIISTLFKLTEHLAGTKYFLNCRSALRLYIANLFGEESKYCLDVAFFNFDIISMEMTDQTELVYFSKDSK